MKQKNLVRAKVLSITGGGTFKVRLRGRTQSISIACIDAPRIFEYGTEFGGQEAKDALIGMLKVGSEVRLKEHFYDRYGRLVAKVYNSGGENIGLELTRQGFAEVDDLFAYQCNIDRLTKFEQTARRQRKGIWSNDNSQTLTSGMKVDADLPDDDEPIIENPESEIPLFTGSNRVTCAELSSQSVAKEWVAKGHTYLDNDGDSFPCESLLL